MRRLTFLGAFSLVLGVTAVVMSPASAETTCQVVDPTTGRCVIRIEVPTTGGDEGPRDTGNGAPCYWDPKKQGLSTPKAGPVACASESGYWSNHYMCYIRILQPQPPATDPAWRGHQPGDGAVYDCYTPQTQINIYVWSQNRPPGASAGPTPRQVAEIAIDQMDLRAITIGLAPRTDGIGLVGMPVWMWAANADRHTVGPNTASASAGGITIMATARLRSITWDMGDGTKVTCTGGGTPYKAAFGKKESPTCGHIYLESSASESGSKYAVTATSSWVVTWSGAGQTGTIRLNGLQRTTDLSVGEAQVLVQ